MNFCQGSSSAIEVGTPCLPALGYHSVAANRGCSMCAQLPLPTLLGSVRPPPGLEAFGPSLPLLKQRTSLAQLKMDDSDSQESESCRSDCSTADTSDAVAFAGSQASKVQEPTFVIELEKALPSPVCGTPDCPSLGSAGHALGVCKPCDFQYRTSCRSGASCKFCHLCGPGESRRRKKQKQSMARSLKKSAAQQMQAQVFAPTMSVPPSRSSRLLLLQDLVPEAC